MLDTFNFDRTEQIVLSDVQILYAQADLPFLQITDEITVALHMHDAELHQLMPLHARMASLAVHLAKILASRSAEAEMEDKFGEVYY